MSNEIQTTNQHQIVNWLQNPATLSQLRTALPNHFPAERMARLALTAFRTNRGLLNCSPASIMAAIMTAAQLGLEPHVNGHCYLVPHGNECTLIVGYQGLLDLIRRSGQVKMISARVVYESDVFEIAYEQTPPFKHRPHLRRAATEKVVGVYMHAILEGGEHVFEYMTVDDVNAIRNRARAGKSGPWSTDWNEMARKTVLRRGAKYLPRSVNMADALDIADRAEASAYVDATAVTTPERRAAHGAMLPPPPPPSSAPSAAAAAAAADDDNTAVVDATADDDDAFAL